jgi:two-component system response regulator HydG
MAALSGLLLASALAMYTDESLILVLLAVTTAVMSDQILQALQRALPSRKLALAARAAMESLAGAESVEEVVRATLDPLRDPADVRVTGELWLVEDARRATLDVASTVKFQQLTHESERALLAWLRAHPGQVAYADTMREARFERADAPAVLAALHAREAFAAVSGMLGDCMAVVLIVPRAGRIEPPEWHEREALKALARRCAAAVESAKALESARARALAAEQREREAFERRAAAERERDYALGRVARAPSAVRLTASLETVWVGYSRAMRTLDQQLKLLANKEQPVLIVCSANGPREAVAWRVHGHSVRAGAPCVVVDASRMHPRDASATLFGTDASGEGDTRVEAQAGAVELAGDGTLAIFDVQALSAEALAQLTSLLGPAKQTTRVGGVTEYTLRARVLLFARKSAVDSALPATLCELVEAEPVKVPSLAGRVEDLETKVLLAIERACRVLGRDPVGIGREAMEALRMWPWPGDDRELDEVIERAVSTAHGGRITVEDLPLLVAKGSAGVATTALRVDGRLEGVTLSAAESETYDALERRILEASLERSNGNKSEAARELGLARTTFLDKLRKHGLRE